jgi:formylmethanofuran dehydrogenase subunit A
LLQGYQESAEARDYEETSTQMDSLTEITDKVCQFITGTPIESIRKLVSTEIISTLLLIWDVFNSEDSRCYACFFSVDILMNTIVQHLMDGDFKEEWMKDTTDMINKRRHHQDLTQNHLFRFSQLTALTKTLDAYVLCGDEERNHYKNLSPFTVRIKSITGNNLSAFDRIHFDT